MENNLNESEKNRDRRSWTNEKRYFKTGYFGLYVRQFKKDEYLEIKDMLNRKKENFKQIYEQLNEDKRIEFSLDFIDNLDKLSKFQKDRKYKFLIDSFRKEIESNNLEIDLFYDDGKLSDKQKDYFTSYKAFKLFEEYKRGIETKVTKKEYSFIYLMMSMHELIKENITPTNFRDWINEEYKDANLEYYFLTYEESYNEKSNINYRLLIDKYKINLPAKFR